jgi:DGQHR domain-containing protein
MKKQRKYEIVDFQRIFEHAGIELTDIQGMTFSIVDKKSLISKGKTRKKDAAEGELDLFGCYEKVIFLVEFTNEQRIETHRFDNFIRKIEILNDKREFLKELINKINQKFKAQISVDLKDLKLVGLYANPTLNYLQCKTLEGRLSAQHRQLIYIWDSDTFEYFRTICGTIRKFSKYELFSYFGITPELVFNPTELEGRKGAVPYVAIKIEKGMFGYPTYTLKIHPAVLLERCYVLRNEGWRSDSFQRMVIPQKLGNIRQYILKHKNTSFANNIIVSPSPDVDPNDIIDEQKEKTIIHIPYKFSSLCIIDGQHRLLAFTQDFYGENDTKEKDNDASLRKLSESSEIIVTLVRFSGNKEEILRKQATLFRDINSTQTRVKTDFIYNLQEIIDPLDNESIGNKVIKYLNALEDGVLKDKFEIKSLPSYRGRIKRSSIVRWGLRELVDIGKDYLFSVAPNEIKKSVQTDLESYVSFSGQKLEEYFECIKEVFNKKYQKNVWDDWRKCGFMLLSTSSIVGFLRLYRHFIKSGNIKDEEMKEYLKAIKINFRKEKYVYTSSQWAKLEEAMFDKIRKRFSDFGDEKLIKRSRK